MGLNISQRKSHNDLASMAAPAPAVPPAAKNLNATAPNSPDLSRQMLKSPSNPHISPTATATATATVTTAPAAIADKKPPSSSSTSPPTSSSTSPSTSPPTPSSPPSSDPLSHSHPRPATVVTINFSDPRANSYISSSTTVDPPSTLRLRGLPRTHASSTTRAKPLIPKGFDKEEWITEIINPSPTRPAKTRSFAKKLLASKVRGSRAVMPSNSCVGLSKLAELR